MTRRKVIKKEKFPDIHDVYKIAGKKIVLCHGVFDLLHYGHIEHLQEAKKQGDILVVTVTAAPFVNKGPGRPYFNDEQRMAFLASLAFVDHVILSEAATVIDILPFIQPDVYVKGQEYADKANDISGNIEKERAAVEAYGGKLYFTQGAVFSSTNLLNNFFNTLPDELVSNIRTLKEMFGIDLIDKIRTQAETFLKLKVLVIGDVIIDEYVFCNLQGLTSKDSALSVRYDAEEKYLGGSLAIARHCANFADVTVCSMLGSEKYIHMMINDGLKNVKKEFVYDDSFVTPVKRRYLKVHPLRQEYDKLFSVNNLLSKEKANHVDYGKFHEKLEKMLPCYDVVIVGDYGHGLIDDKTIKILQEKAMFLAVNCQTNSSNYGMNLITKYQKADMFVVDEKELRLAFGQAVKPHEQLIKNLQEMLHSKYAWVTLGADGAFGMKDDSTYHCPAVTLTVKDTVGAGDAFYSLAALCAATEMPIEIATLMSNVSGAIKTNMVGNSGTIEKVTLLKFLNSILNV